MKFPASPRARLAVTSWPFREFIDYPDNSDRNHQKPGMDIKDFAGMIVKKFGIQNICLLAGHFHSTDSAYLSSLRKAVERGRGILPGVSREVR